MTNPQPAGVRALSAEFYVACGLTEFVENGTLGPIYDDPAQGVRYLLRDIEEVPFREDAPDWVHTPGSPTGLMALAAIAEELGHAVHRDERTGILSIHLIGEGVGILAIGTNRWWIHVHEQDLTTTYGTMRAWTDPDALPRLLHLLLALRPTPEAAP